MKSMTGFGRATCTIGGVSYRLELRALNSRFLDLKSRLPWTDAEIETRTAALFRERLARGRIELSVCEEPGRAGFVLSLDEAVAANLAAALRQLALTCECDTATAARLLPRVPELLRARPAELSSDAIWAPLSLGLTAALDQLVDMRSREGKALRADIAGHLQRLSEIVVLVGDAVAGEATRIKERLEQRLAQVTGIKVDPNRLAQEAAILADRADVSEELARLKSHLDELGRILDRDAPTGRALEFMLQEVNRELNTVASKTTVSSVTSAIVEAKGLVEKVREQAQNVE